MNGQVVSALRPLPRYLHRLLMLEVHHRRCCVILLSVYLMRVLIARLMTSHVRDLPFGIHVQYCVMMTFLCIHEHIHQ